MHPLTEKRTKLAKEVQNEIYNINEWLPPRMQYSEGVARHFEKINQKLAFLIEAAIEEGIASGKEIAVHDLWKRIKNESRTGWPHSLESMREQAELKND